MPAESCSNCGATPISDYCPACGQSRQARLTFRGVVGSALGSLADLDRGFLHTLIGLTTRPGATARAYVDGRRLPYTNPVKYCFIVITVYALAVNVLDLRIDIPGAAPRTDLEQQISQIVHGLLAYLMFLTLYPVSVLQRWLFRESGLRAAENYVFCLYTFGHVTWISVLFAVSRLLEDITAVIGLMVLQVAYLVWALHGFYRCRRPPVLRGLLVVVASAVILNGVSFLIGNLVFRLGLVDFLSGMLVS